MSDSSRHNLYYVAESTYGTTPASPTMKRLRTTNTTLGLTKSTNISEELDGSRQVKDFRHGTRQGGGETGFELSYGSFEDVLEAVLLGTIAPAVNIIANTGISALTADDSIQGGADSLYLDAEPGDVITMSGWSTAGNNGTFTIEALTIDPSIQFVENLVDDPGGEAVTITSARRILKAGTTRRSFSLLRHFTDLTSGDKPFHLHTGAEPNTLSLNLAPGGIVTGTIGWIFRDLTASGTAPASSTLQSPLTTRVFDSFTGSLKENDATLAIVTELSFTLENGLEPRFVLFDDKTLRPSIGRSNLTGQMTCYFENSTLLEKFLDETQSSLDVSLIDKDGNTIRIRIFNIVYNGAQPDTSGQGAITIALPFQAIYDVDHETQIQIDFIDA